MKPTEANNAKTENEPREKEISIDDSKIVVEFKLNKARNLFLINFPTILSGIEKDPILKPSQSYKYACDAAIILLYVQRFLHEEMLPKLKAAMQISSGNMINNSLPVTIWSNFENELINEVKKKLYETEAMRGGAK